MIHRPRLLALIVVLAAALVAPAAASAQGSCPCSVFAAGDGPGGDAITDSPLEVGMKFRSDVSGKVTGVAGIREAAAVVIFPEDQSKLWPRTRYLRMARLETGNGFAVADLPVGRYLAIAVAELETGEESNPELLQRFRSAARERSRQTKWL